MDESELRERLSRIEEFLALILETMAKDVVDDELIDLDGGRHGAASDLG